MGTDLFGTAGGRGASGHQARPAAQLSDLALVGVKAGERGSFAIDPYIRLAYTSPPDIGAAVPVMVRDPLCENLVEALVDAVTGRLRGLSLVNFVRKAQPHPIAEWQALPRAHGLPLFATGAAPAIAETSAAIDVLRGDTAVVCRIGTGAPDALVADDRAIFLFRDNRLWGFGAERLTAEEVARAAD